MKSPTFEEYKTKFDTLFQELCLALESHDDSRTAQILKEKDEIKKRFEKQFGRFAEFRVAPVHSSHRMIEWKEDIAVRNKTPRSFTIRYCIFCDASESHHVIEHKVDERLYHPCLEQS